MTASVTHAETYTFVTKWGSQGSGNGEFRYPGGIAVDSSGNIYVADGGNNRIQKFDSNGKYLTQWGSKGNSRGQFYSPEDISIDSLGNVFVTDLGNSRIEKFDRNGKYLSQWGSNGSGDGEFYAPRGIAVDSSGNVYIADGGNYRIQKFDSNGNYLSQWGSYGFGNGQFCDLTDVFVDSSGTIYAVDLGCNDRIQKFDNNGNYLTQWGSVGSSIGEFSDPMSAAVDSSDNIYVAEYTNSRVQKFDNNGNYLTQWGSWGSADGQFDRPEGIAVDSSGNVYVTESENNRIQKFAVNTDEYKVIPVAGFSTNVTSGNVPLTVGFIDQSTGLPISRLWDFGDGGNSIEQNPIHTYSAAEEYTVNLTVSNENGTDSKSASIIVSNNHALPRPVANFSTNPISGYAPLYVRFTDLSENATEWNWDFGNGDTSTEQNPECTYSSTGNYTVKLTVSNGSITASKTDTVNVLEGSSSNVSDDIDGSSFDGSSSDRSSSGGSSSSSGSGGGGGGSPEPQKNVEVKEVSQAFVTNGKAAKFEFPMNATCIVYVNFDAKKTLGKITTIAEMLKGKSTLVPDLPEGEVYRSFNVWVGNGGTATSENIENPVICFKVEKSWLQKQSIDPASIVLNLYTGEKWEQFPGNISGEDSEYLYFTSKVTGFSSFAITGRAKNVTEQLVASEQSNALKQQEVYGQKEASGQQGKNSHDAGSVKLTSESSGGITRKGLSGESASGFETAIAIVCLLSVLLYRRKK